MIVRWKENRVKVIPFRGGKGKDGKLGPILGKVTLLPGINDIKDEHWRLARVEVASDLRRKRIEEIKDQVTVKKATKTEDEKVEIKGVSINDLNPNEAEDLIDETYSLTTLREWKQGTAKESLRAKIINQIEIVEKYGTKKKSKKQQEQGQGQLEG